MGGEDQEWRVSKASQSCMAIHRRTYCFWISLRIHYRSLCSCHKHIMGAKEVKNGCALSVKQLLNTFFQDFSPHTPSSNFFFPPPTPQANPTSQTQHSPIKHMCVCVCVCPLPSVSPWLDCGSSSAPCDRVELWLSFTSFSTYPQVLFPGIPKPAHPLLR